MATNRINPSRNANDNETRQSYGYVIRVEDISKIEPHATIVGFIVFNQADGCFYRCEEVNDTVEHLQYYTWKAVTFGAHRAYLMPVGKLTVADIGYTTEKDQIECIGKTLNELVFQFHRYNKTFDLAGYVKASGTYISGKTYYKWSWNDTISGISLETHKAYTGEFVKLVAGTDYTVGDEIPDGVYIQDGTIGETWATVDMSVLCDRMNAMIDELNVHGAGIPPVYNTDTYNRLSQVLNLFIDEVNPFSVPWQLLLNRMNTLEGGVGHVSLQTTHITEEKLRETTDLAKWYSHVWLNYVEEFTTEFPQLFYGTICQAVDSSLNVIKYLDTKIGSISSIPDIGTRTLAQYIYEVERRAEWYNDSIASLDSIRRCLYDDTTDDAKKGIGYVRAGLTESTVFADATDYYVWVNKVVNGCRWCLYSKLVAGTDYTVGDKIQLWESVEGHSKVYVWDSSKTASKMIAACQSDISTLSGKFTAIVGETLETIYVEETSGVIVGSRYYYMSSEGNLIVFTAAEGKTLESYRTLYDSPIYRELNNDILNALKQIAQNNRELVRGLKAAHDTRKTLEAADTKQTTCIEKLFDGTGMDGAKSTPSTWRVDGYAKIATGDFLPEQKYFTPGTPAGTWREMVAGTDYTIPYYALTTDIACDDTKTYYVKKLDGTFREATKGTEAQVTSGAADYYVGMVVPENRFYEFHNPTPISNVANVYIRDISGKNNQTHRGLIDRNTDHIHELRKTVQDFQSSTTAEMDSMRSLVLSITLATLELVEKDETALPRVTDGTLEFTVKLEITIFKIHNMLNRLITIHNAIDLANEYFPMRPAYGKFVTGFSYYIPSSFQKTVDPVVMDGKTYFLKSGDVYTYAPLLIGDPIADGNEYYEANIWREMVAERDYEYGQTIPANVFTKEFVFCPTENYTMSDIRIALDSVLLFHLIRKELPTYAEYPSDEVIQGGRVYWKYENTWRKIVPEMDDPEMIGQRIEEYDPNATWYIRLADVIPPDKYTVTDARITLNELIKIHRKGS